MITCFINPFSESQYIRDDITNEEYWVDKNNLVNTLFSLCSEKGYDKIWFEGPYSDSYDIILQLRNKYPEANISIAVN